VPRRTYAAKEINKNTIEILMTHKKRALLGASIESMIVTPIENTATLPNKFEGRTLFNLFDKYMPPMKIRISLVKTIKTYKNGNLFNINKLSTNCRTNTLSASGSIIFPNSVIILNFLAINPSRRSDANAIKIMLIK
jgi:hypothetical protein